VAPPKPQRLEPNPPILCYKGLILIIDRQSAKVFVKLDVTPQAFFRLHHAGLCARVTGKVAGLAQEFGRQLNAG